MDAPEPGTAVPGWDSESGWGAAASGLDRQGLVAEVRRVLVRTVPHGASVLVACSGGPDSTALAYLVPEARSDLRMEIAHVRHGLRDDQADADTARAHAAALGVRYHERAAQVAEHGSGPEASAREARYTALRRIARREQIRWVLLGHTADDQAETVLLNIARGTGLRGIAGMSAERAEGDLRLVRPLLRLRRADVRGFAQGEGLAAVSDPTNRDPRQRRARARHDLLPALASLAGGPGDPVGALTRLADLARSDADALEELAQAHARRIVVAWGPVRAVPADELAALPTALAARVVRLVLTGVRGSANGLTADAVAAVLNLGPGQALHVPGGAWVTSGGGWIAAAPAGLRPLERRAVAVPGSTPLPELGIVLRSDLPWGAGSDHVGQGRLELGDLAVPVLGEARLPPPAPHGPLPPRAVGAATRPWTVLPACSGLAVRARKPGDRIQLSAGRRKLQDLFVDHGVPRAARDLVPVVVDADDEPVWVPGIAARAWDVRAPAGPRLWLAPRADGLLGYALTP